MGTVIVIAVLVIIVILAVRPSIEHVRGKGGCCGGGGDEIKLPKKKQAIISYDRDVDSDEIKSLIEKMDYTVEKVEKLPA